MVGTYGVASAQYYCSRAAAYGLPHLGGVLVGHGLRGRLLRNLVGLQIAGIFLLFLSLVGCPISWHKNALGPQNLWLGRRVDSSKGTAWLPDDKLERLQPMLQFLLHLGEPHKAANDLSPGPPSMGSQGFPEEVSAQVGLVHDFGNDH